MNILCGTIVKMKTMSLELEHDLTGCLSSDVDCNPKQKEGKPVCHVSVCHTSFHAKQMMKLGLDPGPGVASLLQHQRPLESVQQDLIGFSTLFYTSGSKRVV